MAALIRLGLNGDQARLIESLNREGLEHIQTSGGLCVKAPVADVKKLFPEVTVQALTAAEESSPDVRAFLST